MKNFYSMFTNTLILMGAPLSLLGCVSAVPDSIVVPTTPVANVALAPARNGTIFNEQSYQPMFEDVRARRVGDTLIITIAEKTSAGKNIASSTSKDNSVHLNAVVPLGIGSIGGKSALNNAEKAAANAANNFTGTVTATVTEVLASGNLRVRGEKQVAFDRGTEFIRFSGIFNPTTIHNNTVPSTTVADMRVEYRSNTNFDKAALQSVLARFFFSVLPL